MTTGSIFTTGGTLVEGDPDELDRIESLIDQLGVLPPWQACYYVPEELLIHIVTARRRDFEAGTRKADNYYLILEASDTQSADLWQACQGMLESRIGTDDGPWEAVASDDTKSELSSPEHIYSIVGLKAEPQTLPERGIAHQLDNGETPLRFGFTSTGGLQTAVRRFDHCGAPILYATERKANEFLEHGLECAFDADLDFEPVDSKTIGVIETATATVAKERRETHLQTVYEAIDNIDNRVATDDVSPEEVLSVLTALRVDETEIDAASECLQQPLDSIRAQREQVSVEAVVDPVGDHGDLAAIASDHVSQFEAELTTAIDEMLSRLREDVITDRARCFEKRVQTEIEGLTDRVDIAYDQLDAAFSERFLAGDTDGDGGFLVDMFSPNSTTDIPAELAQTIDTFNQEVYEELVPELAGVTGLTESQVQSRFREAVEMDIESMDR
jgi:hypothetical protein